MKLSIILRIIYADQGRRRRKAEANNPLPVVDPWLMLIIYTNFQTETLSYRNCNKGSYNADSISPNRRLW